MEIEEVTSYYYKSIFNSYQHKFNSVDFINLNSSKCDLVHFLIFKDSKIRLGLIIGERNNSLISPFSAPFGGFDVLNREIKLYQIEESLKSLEIWSRAKKIDSITIVLPPYFYGNNLFVKFSNCLQREGYEIAVSEVNYHFETVFFNDNYFDHIWPNARRSLKISNNHPLSFHKIESNRGIEAYKIIAQNRLERGFPLRLTYEQLKDTESAIPIDYFLVFYESVAVASAIVFHVTKTIVRVVYWGDIPKYSEFKTMNFLSFNIFNYYKCIGVEYIDIGHSTVNSVPNHGLCEFKESIGCTMGFLNSYQKKL